MFGKPHIKKNCLSYDWTIIENDHFPQSTGWWNPFATCRPILGYNKILAKQYQKYTKWLLYQALNTAVRERIDPWSLHDFELARWRGAREPFEIFETCWQDLNLNLTLFSWADRMGLIEPIKSQYFSPPTFINSIMRQSTDCNKMWFRSYWLTQC